MWCLDINTCEARICMMTHGSPLLIDQERTSTPGATQSRPEHPAVPLGKWLLLTGRDGRTPRRKSVGMQRRRGL
jgi:hypothetical protein